MISRRARTSFLVRSIDMLSKAGGINLRALANKRLGILQWQSSRASGELLFVSKILPALLKEMERPVLFDVGLNEGKYSSELLRVFPRATLYAFEPVASNFHRARERLAERGDVRLENLAVSDHEGEMEIFDYADRDGSSHASPYKDVITQQHGADEVAVYRVRSTSLDRYCDAHKIDKIDFIKIDTEGHELAVLKGCETLIRDRKIKIAQFEFNEMNVLSRSFLRDFYLALENFKFYRLREDGLLPLGKYNAINEVFKYQNIVAVCPSISDRAVPFEIEDPWR